MPVSLTDNALDTYFFQTDTVETYHTKKVAAL